MTAEKRIETESGGAKGDKIFRFDQIPAGPMMEVAARYGLGSTKYPQKNGLDNWRNGYPFSLSMAALERHWYAWKGGEDYDATIYAEAGLLADDEHPLYDTEGKLRPGVNHLAAVVWHCFFLMHHSEHNPHLDDRPSTVLRRNAEAALRKADELREPFIEAGDGSKSSDEVVVVDQRDKTPSEIFRIIAAGLPEAPTFDVTQDAVAHACATSKKAHRELLNAWHNRPQVHLSGTMQEVSVEGADIASVGPDIALARADEQPTGGAITSERIRRIGGTGLARVDEWAQLAGVEIHDYDGFRDVDTYALLTRKEFLERVATCTVKFDPDALEYGLAISQAIDDAYNAPDEGLDRGDCGG